MDDGFGATEAAESPFGIRELAGVWHLPAGEQMTGDRYGWEERGPRAQSGVQLWRFRTPHSDPKGWRERACAGDMWQSELSRPVELGTPRTLVQQLLETTHPLSTPGEGGGPGWPVLGPGLCPGELADMSGGCGPGRPSWVPGVEKELTWAQRTLPGLLRLLRVSATVPGACPPCLPCGPEAPRPALCKPTSIPGEGLTELQVPHNWESSGKQSQRLLLPLGSPRGRGTAGLPLLCRTGDQEGHGAGGCRHHATGHGRVSMSAARCPALCPRVPFRVSSWSASWLADGEHLMKDVPVPASLVLQDLSLWASAVPPFPRLGVSEVDRQTYKER